MSKAFDISSATARVASNMFKALAILSDTTVGRSAFNREDLLKTILEIKTKATFLEGINNPIINKFFKDFTNHRKKTNMVIYSCRTFLNIHKYRDHQ